MRLHLVLLVLFGLLLPAAPAAADVTIRYTPDPPGDRGMVIEADSQGRIRAETGPGQAIIFRDGDIFMVIPDEDGPTVVRLDDFLAVATEAAQALRQRPNIIHLRPPSPNTHYRLSERGPETVGAWHGTRLAIEELGQHDPAHDVQWVVSNDPALAEAGRIVNRVFDVQNRIFETALGAQPPEFTALFRQMSGRGTPLRVYNFYHLESLGADPVPASRFELPVPALSREQFRARHIH